MRTIKLPNGKTLSVPDDLSTEEEHAIIGQELNPAFGGGTATQYQAPGQAQAEPMTTPQPQPIEQPWWKSHVLPTAGLVGGALVGRTPGAALGAMAGEFGNQMLGVTPGGFDPNTIAAQGEGALLGPPLGKVLGAVGRAAPGAGIPLNEWALTESHRLPGMIKPAAGVGSKELYGLLEQNIPGTGPTMIKSEGILKTARDMLQKELSIPIEETRHPEVMKLAENTIKSLEARPEGLPLNEFRLQHSRFGQDMKFAAAKPTPLNEANEKLYASAEKDLDATIASGNPASPHVQVLKSARQAYKLERTSDELADMVKAARKPQAHSDLDYLDGKGLLQAIRKNPRIQALPKEDLQDITETAQMLKRIPALPVGGGVQAGSMRVAVGGGIGALGGYGAEKSGMGEHGTMAAMTATGIIAPVIIAKAMGTQLGRALLRGMLKANEGTLGPTSLSVLTAFLASEAASPNQEALIRQSGEPPPPQAGLPR